MSHVCPTPCSFDLVVEAPIVAKGRPRFGRSRTGRMVAYTPPKTIAAERLIHAAWVRAGRPRVADGAALDVEVRVTLARPKSHYTRSGSLSAAGRRAVYPTGRPDLDNVCKLALDALNTHAWRDDAAVCRLRTQKEYGDCDVLRIRVVCFCHRTIAG